MTNRTINREARWQQLHEIFTGDELDVLRELVMAEQERQDTTCDFAVDSSSDDSDSSDDMWRNTAIQSLIDKSARPHEWPLSAGEKIANQNPNPSSSIRR